MAVSSHVFGLALQSMLNKEINFASDTVKAMLVTSAYTPSMDTHRYKSSVTNEASGTGYTAGGQTLTSKTVSYNTASHTLTLSCANPSWPSSAITARYLVFYVSTGTDSTSPLIAYVDFGVDTVSVTTGPAFTYTVPSTGIAQFIAA
jgi:hypothetical protein